MSNKKTAINESIVSGRKFLTDNATKLNVITDLPDEEDTLDAIIANIALGLKLKGKTPNVTSKDVDDFKRIMSKKVFKGLKKALSKSRSLKNTVLINMFSFPSDYILKGDKVIASQRAGEIRDLLDGKKSILTSVTAAIITEISTSITNFDAVKDVPVMSIKNRKSFGTALYNSSLTDGREELKTIQLMIEGEFEENDLPFTKAFRNSIKIVNLGVRHTPTTFNFMTENGGVYIGKAKFYITNKQGVTKEYTANDKGIKFFETFMQGEYTGIAKADLYVDTPFGMKVIGRQTNEFTIVMKAS